MFSLFFFFNESFGKWKLSFPFEFEEAKVISVLFKCPFIAFFFQLKNFIFSFLRLFTSLTLVLMYSLFVIGICMTLVTSIFAYTSSYGPSRKWFKELFSDAEQNFSMDAAVNPKCRSDFQLYMSHLRNQSVWSVRSKC